MGHLQLDGLGWIIPAVQGVRSLVGDSRDKRRKKRAKRAAFSAAIEADRAQRVTALAAVRERTLQAVGGVANEVNRVTNAAASIALYAGRVEAQSTRDMLLGQVQQIQIAASDLTAKTADYETGTPEGDEPAELAAELRDQADRELKDATAVLRQAKGLANRSELLRQQAMGAYQRQEQEKRALAVAQELERQKALLRATAARYAAVPYYTDTAWGAALLATPPLANPELLAPSAVNGFAGGLTDLFSSGKKDKEREKKAAQQVMTRAEIELRRQEADLAQRRVAQIRLFTRDVEIEAGLAAQAIDGVRVGIDTAPSLPPAVLNEAAQAVLRWEPQVTEILAGVRAFDLRNTERGAQEAFLSQAAGALAAMRAVRIEASALHQRIMRAGALSRSNEDRVRELLAQQQALGVRERAIFGVAQKDAALDLAEQTYAAQQASQVKSLAVARQVEQERLALQLSMTRLRGLERSVGSTVMTTALRGGAW